jgi:hypothetical protein
MLEKYLKLIKESRDKKKGIQDFFLSLNMTSDNFSFDVQENILKIKTNSNNRFLLKLNENKIKDFCAKNRLIYKVF